MSKIEKVEWKDTRLNYCVDYDYSLFVRNRCVFFYGEAAKWRKTMNFAEKFLKPWNICVVFLYGEAKWREDTFCSRIAETNGNLIVLHFNEIKNEWLSLLADHKQWEKIMGGCGLVKDGEFTELYLNEREIVENAVRRGDLPCTDSLYLKYQKDRSIVEAYNEALGLVQKAQYADAVCYSTFLDLDVMQASNDSLTRAICKRFPFGVEADTTDEQCVKMVAIGRYINSALEKKPEMEIAIRGEEAQLSLFDNSTIGASSIVSTLQDYCRDAIRTRGRFYLAEAWNVIEQAPFGAYECNWYMYLFAFALSEFFTEGYHLLCSYHPQKANECDKKAIIKGLYGCIFVVTDTQKRLANAITNLFDGIETDYITEALADARTWCENNVQTPIAFVDERFSELLDFDCDKWTKKGEETKYLPWIEKELPTLRKKVREVDKDFDQMLVDMGYDPERVKLYRIFNHVKRGAVGWLHTKNMMMEGVDKYMKHENVCRECGKPIEKHYAYVMARDSSSTKIMHDELIFTAKEIVGLNKKFLGKDQDKFFCIKCLCEILETNEETLYEKMQGFKEEGCQLFG